MLLVCVCLACADENKTEHPFVVCTTCPINCKLFFLCDVASHWLNWAVPHAPRKGLRLNMLDESQMPSPFVGVAG